MLSLKLITAKFVGNQCQVDDLKQLPEEVSTFVRAHMSKERQMKLWNGKVMAYYSSLNVSDEFNYNKQGKLHGARISWRQNGLQWREETYQNGVLNGPMFVFHNNGRLAKCCIWKDGKCMQCQHWHIDGRPYDSSEYIFKRNKRNNFITYDS